MGVREYAKNVCVCVAKTRESNWKISCTTSSLFGFFFTQTTVHFNVFLSNFCFFFWFFLMYRFCLQWENKLRLIDFVCICRHTKQDLVIQSLSNTKIKVVFTIFAEIISLSVYGWHRCGNQTNFDLCNTIKKIDVEMKQKQTAKICSEEKSDQFTAEYTVKYDQFD